MPKPSLSRGMALAMLACAGLRHTPPALAQAPAGPAANAHPAAIHAAQGAVAPAGSGQDAPGAVAHAVSSTPPVAPTGGAGSPPDAALANTAASPGNVADAAAPAAAPKPAKAEPPTATAAVQLATTGAIAADQSQLKTITGVVGRLQAEAAQARTDDSLTGVRQDAGSAQASADAFAKARLAEVSAFNQQLKRYSTSAGKPRPRLSVGEQRERADLLARRNQVAGLAKTAEQAAATASGVYNAVANRRRSDFAAHVFTRTASPLQAAFWDSLAASVGPDLQRLARLLQDTAATATDAPEPRGLLSLTISLALALALAVPVRRGLTTLVRRRPLGASSDPPPAPEAAGGDGAPGRDLGQSARAVGAVLIDTLLPGLAAVMVNLGLTWGELISDKTEALAQALVVAVFWGAAIVALSRQLAGDPDERLLAVSERLSSHMRALPWLIALITGAGFLLRRINIVVGASLAATIAANCLVALAYAGVASLVLLALGSDQDVENADADVRQPGRVLVSLALSAAIVVTVGAVLAGFTTFAALVSSQIFWISVVTAVTYLLIRFTDDVIARLFAPRGWLGRLLTVVLNLRLSTVNQLGVLSSAVAQVLIAVGAIGLALTPFGSNGDLLADRFGHFGEAVHVGSITLSPSSMGAGLASLIIGLGLVHLVERWVDRRYLPVTDWDSGVRNSVSTGVRYLGVGLTILWALAAAGLGFKQIALVASALSVGIGFGLQQIVQNFVSGLILLVERPVKVGDWVNLGAGLEGDVQRIRVRATEIRTFDRTTVIVPNSDLITKQVQNKTLGDPRGRVRLEISVGAAGDAPRASAALETLLTSDAEVLDDPPPQVLVDSLTSGGSVNYVCFAYVASARDTLQVKSRLYTEVLELFAREKIGFIGGPGLNYVEPGPEMKAFVSDLAGRLKPAPAPAEGAGGGAGAAP